jgi:hypothetical protein
VATSRRDYDHIVNLIRDKEDLLEPMLEDPKLTERLFHDEEAFLLFSVLLRPGCEWNWKRRRISLTWTPTGNVSRSLRVRQ